MCIDFTLSQSQNFAYRVITGLGWSLSLTGLFLEAVWFQQISAVNSLHSGSANLYYYFSEKYLLE